MRLDEYLINEGLLPDKEAALRSVIAGEVLVDEVVAKSAAQKVKLDSYVRVRASRQYVSRGGNKLKGGLKAFQVDVQGLRCLDIGSSTGGFTDCLLQNGASQVTCVDVNYGQLAWSIRSNPKVRVFERTNIKTALPSELGAPFDLIVIDVSFIGLASLAHTIANLCEAKSQLLALIKPQFESKRGETEGGVVRDEEVRLRTVDEVKDALTQSGFLVDGVVESPIKGPAGNIEYLLHAVYGGGGHCA